MGNLLQGVYQFETSLTCSLNPTMDLVRSSDRLSCVRTIFLSFAEGYVIATDLQGFIPESYLRLLTLTTGGWEQCSQHLQHSPPTPTFLLPPPPPLIIP